MKKAKKIVVVLTLATLAFAVYYIVSNIIGSFIYFTSFPWWSAFVFAAYYFGPVLLIEGLALLGIYIWEKRKKD